MSYEQSGLAFVPGGYVFRSSELLRVVCCHRFEDALPFVTVSVEHEHRFCRSVEDVVERLELLAVE